MTSRTQEKIILSDKLENEWNKNLEAILKFDDCESIISERPLKLDELEEIVRTYDAVVVDMNFFYPHCLTSWHELVGTDYLTFLLKEYHQPKKDTSRNDEEEKKRLSFLEKEIKATKHAFISYEKNMLKIVKDSDNLYINTHVVKELNQFKRAIKRVAKSGKFNPQYSLMRSVRFKDRCAGYMRKAVSSLDGGMAKNLRYKIIQKTPLLMNIPSKGDILYNKRLYNDLNNLSLLFKYTSCSETDTSLFFDSQYIACLDKSVGLFSLDQGIKKMFKNFYTNDFCLKFVDYNEIRNVTLITFDKYGELKQYKREYLKKQIVKQ